MRLTGNVSSTFKNFVEKLAVKIGGLHPSGITRGLVSQPSQPSQPFVALFRILFSATTDPEDKDLAGGLICSAPCCIVRGGVDRSGSKYTYNGKSCSCAARPPRGWAEHGGRCHWVAASSPPDQFPLELSRTFGALQFADHPFLDL